MKQNTDRVHKAMLMAAGLGTRLRPFTDRLAKPLLPVMGVPTAQFAIDSLVSAGVKKLVANVHHLPEATRKGLSQLELSEMRLSFSDESAFLLGSGGGLRQGLDHLGSDPFFFLNGDVIVDIDLVALRARHESMRVSRGAVLTLSIFPESPPGASYRQIEVDAETSMITGLGGIGEGVPFYVGAGIIEPEALVGLTVGEPAEFVAGVLEPAIRSGRAAAFLSSGRWYDTGSPELWLKTHLELINGLDSGNLPKAWDARIRSNSVRIHEGAWIAKNSHAAAKAMELVGPCYWRPSIDPNAIHPERLGPSVVLYGQAPAGANPSEPGIGYDGNWVKSNQTGLT